MPYYVFDDAKNKFEGMTREQIINAIASATGLTPAQIDDDIITTAIKEQNAQRSVNLWVGTQAEYNAIQQPDENTLYIVTDPNETNELQNQVDLLQEQLDAMKESVWDYSQGVANGETLEEYASFSKPLTDYQIIVVTCGAIGGTVQNVVCVKTGTTSFRGSLYNYDSDKMFSVFIRRYYDGSAATYKTTSSINTIEAPFSGQAQYGTMVISRIRGMI